MTEIKYLLASDMDGTMIPLDGDAESLRDLGKVKELLRADAHIRLCYVTGRDHWLALRGVERYGLPEPEHVISDVGTVLSHYVTGRWQTDDGYRDKVAAAYGGKTVDDIASVLSREDRLQPQEDAFQTPFKRSYYFEQSVPMDELRENCSRLLHEAEIPGRLILSVDQNEGRGLLDVLPADIDKSTALKYLAALLNLSEEQVMYAGDSGNDEQAFKAGFLTVLVGNTPEDVGGNIRQWAQRNNAENKVYFAHGNATSGVLEGAHHFGLFPNNQ